MTDPPGEEQGSSLAAKVSALRSGQPLTPLDRAELELALVDIALGNKASWNQIGALVWQCTGPEAKKRVHHLRKQAERARRLEENRKPPERWIFGPERQDGPPYVHTFAAWKPCPTDCDPDCELNPDGCHERHGVRQARDHDPDECEAYRKPGPAFTIEENQEPGP